MAHRVFDLETMQDICMDCYTGPKTLGFNGVIKSHSEDFVVTEIDGSGQLVSLTSRDIPQQPPTEVSVAKSLKPRPLASAVPPLRELIDDEQMEALKELADKCKTSSQSDESVNLGCYDDKELRAQVHIAVRMAHPMLMTHTERGTKGEVSVTALPDPKYPRLREALTEEDTLALLMFVNTACWNNSLTLTQGYDRQARTKIHLLLHELFGALLSTHTNTSQQKRRRINKKTTPTDHPPQIAVRFRGRKQREEDSPLSNIVTKFVLRKRNTETLAAIDLLSEVLEVRPSQFACSGVKDKKAVTTQHMTVRGVAPDRLDAVNDHPEVKGQLEVGDYQYVTSNLRTGQHSGNHFTIAIRDITADDETVAMAMKSVQERGFVNYFGPQRFGGGTSAARIALAMLQKQHRKAVDLILTSQSSDKGDAAIARDYYKSTGDIAGTLQKMPLYKTRERYVLKALHRHGNSDYGCVCALNSIPYHWRKLYLQGFNSLLWNYLASCRVQEYGLRPVAGDLVLTGAADKEEVHVLSGSDTEQYSIGDVVLPLLGTGSKFPDHKVASRLTDVLTSLGLTLASFRLTRLGIHTTGAYRRLLAYPKQVSWKRVQSPPVATSTVSGVCTQASSTEGTPPQTEHKSNESEGVEVAFSLDKACYATVMLRELMKTQV